MIGLGQADWFIKNLQRQYKPLKDIDYQVLYNKIKDLSDDKYMFLKRLYYKAFASSDTVKPTVVDIAKFEEELIKLGLPIRE